MWHAVAQPVRAGRRIAAWPSAGHCAMPVEKHFNIRPMTARPGALAAPREQSDGRFRRFALK